MRQKLGECLVQAGLIDEVHLRSALVEQKRTKEHIGVVLVRLNLATEAQVASALALQLGFPSLRLAEHPPDPAAVACIPREVALEHACLAIALEENVLTVAMADPLLFGLVQDVESRTGYRVRPVVATRSEIMDAARKEYAEPPPTRTVRPAVDAVPDSAEISLDGLVDSIVKRTVHGGGAEVRIEATESLVLVRLRLGGSLTDVMTLPRAIHDLLVARFKARAGLDLAERRLPQDGRLRVSPDVAVRVSTRLTSTGERVVLRLEGDAPRLPLSAIGLSASGLDTMKGLLLSPRGLLLVVGPAGAGVRTTVASAFDSMVDDRPCAVVRSGDDLAAAVGTTGGRGPALLMEDEIRDGETAAMALGAAHRGLLVLATLRADTAVSTVIRLLKMGVEPGLVAEALAGVVATRLARRLCDQCRREGPVVPGARHAVGPVNGEFDAVHGYHAPGCDQCHHTGYRGRVGLFEVMRVGQAIRASTRSRGGEAHLRAAAFADGLITLAEDGMSKVRSGVVSAGELGRLPGHEEVRPLCAACGALVGEGGAACLRCGGRRGEGCPYCGWAVESTWGFCPSCGRSAPGGTLHGRLS